MAQLPADGTRSDARNGKGGHDPERFSVRESRL